MYEFANELMDGELRGNTLGPVEWKTFENRTDQFLKNIQP